MSALHVFIRTFAYCATLAAAVAAAETNPPARAEGGLLVGNNGMTLYVFDKDAAGKVLYQLAIENSPSPCVAQPVRAIRT